MAAAKTALFGRRRMRWIDTIKKRWSWTQDRCKDRLGVWRACVLYADSDAVSPAVREKRRRCDIVWSMLNCLDGMQVESSGQCFFVTRLQKDGVAWVACPRGCLYKYLERQLHDAVVFGSKLPVAISSSICITAMFAGVLHDSGGKVDLVFCGAKNGFKGGTANGITVSGL